MGSTSFSKLTSARSTLAARGSSVGASEAEAVGEGGGGVWVDVGEGSLVGVTGAAWVVGIIAVAVAWTVGVRLAVTVGVGLAVARGASVGVGVGGTAATSAGIFVSTSAAPGPPVRRKKPANRAPHRPATTPIITICLTHCPKEGQTISRRWGGEAPVLHGKLRLTRCS